MPQSLRAEWPKGNNLHFLAGAPNLVSTPGVARVSLERVKRARRLSPRSDPGPGTMNVAMSGASQSGGTSFM